MLDSANDQILHLKGSLAVSQKEAAEAQRGQQLADANLMKRDRAELEILRCLLTQLSSLSFLTCIRCSEKKWTCH